MAGRAKRTSGRRPVGNAIYDPANQTKRKDMRDEEQVSEGPPARGTGSTAPSSLADGRRARAGGSSSADEGDETASRG